MRRDDNVNVGLDKKHSKHSALHRGRAFSFSIDPGE